MYLLVLNTDYLSTIKYIIQIILYRWIFFSSAYLDNEVMCAEIMNLIKPL